MYIGCIVAKIQYYSAELLKLGNKMVANYIFKGEMGRGNHNWDGQTKLSGAWLNQTCVCSHFNLWPGHPVALSGYLRYTLKKK